MARPNNPDIEKPKDPADEGDSAPQSSDDPQERANLEGYAGEDGSKSLGHLKHPPAADSSGLASVADDAGRTEQEPGENSGASPASDLRG
jgi:hypothetical protein